MREKIKLFHKKYPGTTMTVGVIVLFFVFLLLFIIVGQNETGFYFM